MHRRLNPFWNKNCVFNKSMPRELNDYTRFIKENLAGHDVIAETQRAARTSVLSALLSGLDKQYGSLWPQGLER